MINFLSLKESKRNSLPRMSFTTKSKKEAGTALLIPSEPDLKTSFCIRPPINKQIIHSIRNRAQKYQNLQNYGANHNFTWLNKIFYVKLQLENARIRPLFYSIIMEGRNVFRRRTTITPQLSQHQSKLKNAESTACSQETTHRKQAKFTKMDQVKQILMRGSQDQEFLKAVDDIKERKGTFYRMGFRSYERKENRKVFADVLGLDTTRSKGTIFVGELWSNREHSRLLKENRIFMNKVKLIDKFQNIRKDLKEAEKQIFHSQIQEPDSNDSIQEIKDPVASTVSCTRRNGNKKYCIAQNLQEIKNGLKQLKKNKSMNSLIGDVRYLQRCQQRLGKVERHYFLKMLQLYPSSIIQSQTKITDTREIKDQNGKLIGRQFLVFRKDYGEKGTWEPFEKLIQSKALKSFYNKHPELPYPNCLAQDSDEEFQPQNQKKNSNRGSKNGQAFKEKKPKGRPPLNQTQHQSNPNILTPQNRPINLQKSKSLTEKLQPQRNLNGDIRVEGLFADKETDQILYHIYANGKYSYQNRKWVMLNCKSELIDFYQRCMRIKQK